MASGSRPASQDEVDDLRNYLNWKCGGLYAAFAALEKTGDGMLRLRDFEEGLRSLGYKRDAAPLFLALDRENRGSIHCSQFVSGCHGNLLDVATSFCSVRPSGRGLTPGPDFLSADGSVGTPASSAMLPHSPPMVDGQGSVDLRPADGSARTAAAFMQSPLMSPLLSHREADGAPGTVIFQPQQRSGKPAQAPERAALAEQIDVLREELARERTIRQVDQGALRVSMENAGCVDSARAAMSELKLCVHKLAKDSEHTFNLAKLAFASAEKANDACVELKAQLQDALGEALFQRTSMERLIHKQLDDFRAEMRAEMSSVLLSAPRPLGKNEIEEAADVAKQVFESNGDSGPRLAEPESGRPESKEPCADGWELLLQSRSAAAGLQGQSQNAIAMPPGAESVSAPLPARKALQDSPTSTAVSTGDTCCFLDSSTSTAVHSAESAHASGSAVSEATARDGSSKRGQGPTKPSAKFIFLPVAPPGAGCKTVPPGSRSWTATEIGRHQSAPPTTRLDMAGQSSLSYSMSATPQEQTPAKQAPESSGLDGAATPPLRLPATPPPRLSKISAETVGPGKQEPSTQLENAVPQQRSPGGHHAGAAISPRPSAGAPTPVPAGGASPSGCNGRRAVPPIRGFASLLGAAAPSAAATDRTHDNSRPFSLKNSFACRSQPVRLYSTPQSPASARPMLARRAATPPAVASPWRASQS